MKFATILASAVLASVEAKPENTSAVKTWKHRSSYDNEVDPDDEKLDGTTTPQILLDLDDAMAHVDKLTDKDDVTSLLDDAIAHVDMLTAIDDAFAHIDTKDDSSDLTVAIDDAFAHVDMMSAIDEAMDHVDMMTAIDDAMDFVQKHQASGSGYSTPIIASAGALLAIGAGFVIKNKFSAVEQKDVEETLL